MMVYRVHEFVDLSGSRGTEKGGGVTVVDPSAFEISEIKKIFILKVFESGHHFCTCSLCKNLEN